MATPEDEAELAADDPTPLAPHIEESVRAIARLHAEHHNRATPAQRLVERMTAIVGHPAFIIGVTLLVGAWIGGDALLRRITGRRLDGEGLPWLQGAGELAAIYITALVLISQRRKDELSELREQLTLELVIMTEQKVAKLIALMEETRRDSPFLQNRIDPQAEAMSASVDPASVHDVFKETQDIMIAGPPAD